MLLLSEVAAFSQTGLTTSWSAEDHVASGAHSSDLGVREDGLKIHYQYILVNAEVKDTNRIAEPARSGENAFAFKPFEVMGPANHTVFKTIH